MMRPHASSFAGVSSVRAVLVPSVLVGLAALVSAPIVVSGCSSGSSTGSGGGGAGITSSSTSSGMGTGGAGSTSSSSGSSSSSGTGGSGGGAAATIQDITTGVVADKTKVDLKGVVAMSHKFLLLRSQSTNSCLWAVFVSAPGLTETAANSGIVVVSYGTPAVIPDGGTTPVCPVLGVDPTGDVIPDATKPGDVLDVTGTVNSYLSSMCDVNAGESGVATYRISETTKVTKTGTAPVPAPHVMTAAEVDSLASGTDKAFHDAWGNVKVRIQNVTSDPQTKDGGTSLTDGAGHILLAGTSLSVGIKVFYNAQLAMTDVCHKSPHYPSTMTTFTSIDGFSTLDFCNWRILPDNRCVDFQPPSDDCMGATCP